MKITETAIQAVLDIMKNQKLDPQEVYFEIKLLPNGAVGIGFNRDIDGQIREFGELKTVISPKIDMEGVVVDFGETNGKKGLLFFNEGAQNVNNQLN